MNTERIQRKYFARGLKSLTFCVHLLDKNGEPMYQTVPSTGQTKFVNNRPVPLEEYRKFQPVPADPRKKQVEFSCFYILEPEDKNYGAAFTALEKLADNPSCEVLRMDDYEKQRNPQAYAEAKRRKETEEEKENLRKEVQEANVQVESLKTESHMKDQKVNEANDKVSQLERQLADARKKMDDLTQKKGPGRPPKG